MSTTTSPALPFLLYNSLMITLPYIAPLLWASYHYTDFTNEVIQSKISGSEVQEFDFIIVGSGTTGSVLANRLSLHFSVLLLEAGGDPIPFLDVPAFFTAFQNSPHVNYAYKTVPQLKSCLGLKNQESYWPEGKALGGSSTINALLWVKGHDKDYDNWARVTGDDGWNSTNLLPFFKRVEHVEEIGDDETLDKRYRGMDGEINVKKEVTELGDRFLKAAGILGYPHQDVNAPYKEAAFDHFYFNRRNGRRSGAFQEFIKPIRDSPRHTLTIRKFATVMEILFNDNDITNTKEAIGVEYTQFGETKQAFAKETIISAGSLESPKLLMLSGIGPKKHLEEMGIPVRLDLPVGENLQDHLVSFFGPHKIDAPITMHPHSNMGLGALKNFLNESASGILTSTMYIANGYVTSSVAKKNGQENWPDIQFVLTGGAVSDEHVSKIIEDRCNTKAGLLDKYFKWSYGSTQHSFILAPVLVRPKSRGTVRLRGIDPYLSPVIDPKYLTHPDDAKVLVEGLQIGLKMLQTEPFKSVGTEINPDPFPGCEKHRYLSNEYFECFIRTFTLAGAHASATCPMGKVGDKDTVVDSELRVVGMKRLRVADASVIPIVPNVNIEWPCMMIGEKAADLLIKEYSKVQ